MNLKNKFKKIFISWDLLLALILTGVLLIFSKKAVQSTIIKSITEISVSTLSIIFSVFFAALAILISSVDNEFVKFLQRKGYYTELLWSYKYTLCVIFFALMMSIIIYVISLFELEISSPGVFPLWIVAPYSFTVIYSLLCTVGASFDAIKYAERRTRYLNSLQKTNKRLKGKSV